MLNAITTVGFPVSFFIGKITAGLADLGMCVNGLEKKSKSTTTQTNPPLNAALFKKGILKRETSKDFQKISSFLGLLVWLVLF